MSVSRPRLVFAVPVTFSGVQNGHAHGREKRAQAKEASIEMF